MKKIGFKNFKDDINHLIIRYNDQPNYDKLVEHLENLVTIHYSHISVECYQYVNERFNSNIGDSDEN